ncbi:transmembrane protein [Citrus sinensis]|nr:transmembrane protein [Citrus sinensis]
MLYETCKEILKIQKFRRIVSYTGFYCFVAVLSYAYTNNTTRAGYSRGDQFYASYPAGTELLTDTTKLYKAALGNCFESEEWGPIEYCIMAKHFERQGKDPYAYHAVSSRVLVMDYKFGCIIVDGEVKRTSNSVLNRASFYE